MTGHRRPDQYPDKSALEAASKAYCHVIDNERGHVPVMATLDDLAKMFVEFQNSVKEKIAP